MHNYIYTGIGGASQRQIIFRDYLGIPTLHLVESLQQPNRHI